MTCGNETKLANTTSAQKGSFLQPLTTPPLLTLAEAAEMPRVMLSQLENEAIELPESQIRIIMANLMRQEIDARDLIDHFQIKDSPPRFQQEIDLFMEQVATANLGIPDFHRWLISKQEKTH